MRIVICNSNSVEAQFYEDLCRELGKTYDVPIELKRYDSSKSLLFDLGDPNFCKKLDVIFFSLDEASLSVPTHIREMGYGGLIVFIGGSEMIIPYEQLFDTETYNFVQNSPTPGHLARFAQIFQTAAKVVAKNRAEKLVLSYAGEIRQVDIQDIQYIEVQKYSLIIHYGKGETFTIISSLSKMENHLKGRSFMRASRFYLISLEAIKELTSNSVLMEDGTQISVGRKYYAELKAAMAQEGSIGA